MENPLKQPIEAFTCIFIVTVTVEQLEVVIHTQTQHRVYLAAHYTHKRGITNPLPLMNWVKLSEIPIASAMEDTHFDYVRERKSVLDACVQCHWYCHYPAFPEVSLPKILLSHCNQFALGVPCPFIRYLSLNWLWVAQYMHMKNIKTQLTCEPVKELVLPRAYEAYEEKRACNRLRAKTVWAVDTISDFYYRITGKLASIIFGEWANWT